MGYRPQDLGIEPGVAGDAHEKTIAAPLRKFHAAGNPKTPLFFALTTIFCDFPEQNRMSSPQSPLKSN